MTDRHPIFGLLEMMRTNLALEAVSVVRSGRRDELDGILEKDLAVEKVEKIAHEMYPAAG